MERKEETGCVKKVGYVVTQHLTISQLVSNLTQKSSQTRENSKASDFGESILGFIVMVFSAIFFVGFLLYAVAGIGVIIAGIAAVILVTQSYGIAAGACTGVAAVSLAVVLFEVGFSKGVSNVIDFVHGRL